MAGFGTGIGYLIPAITGIIVFSKKSGTLSFVKPIIDIKVLGESCINGSSEMVSQLSTAITTFFFNRTMMNFIRCKWCGFYYHNYIYTIFAYNIIYWFFNGCCPSY